MRTAAAQGVFTALDPNIRAGLIPDADAYRARFKSWLPSVSLLKLSEEDALWLGGTPREWLAAGPCGRRGHPGRRRAHRVHPGRRGALPCPARRSTSWTPSAPATP